MAVEIIVAIVTSVIGLIIASGVPSEPNNFQEVSLSQQWLQDLGPAFNSMVLTPTIVYIVNTDLRKYAFDFYGFRKLAH